MKSLKIKGPAVVRRADGKLELPDDWSEEPSEKKTHLDDVGCDLGKLDFYFDTDSEVTGREGAHYVVSVYVGVLGLTDADSDDVVEMMSCYSDDCIFVREFVLDRSDLAAVIMKTRISEANTKIGKISSIIKKMTEQLGVLTTQIGELVGDIREKAPPEGDNVTCLRKSST